MRTRNTIIRHWGIRFLLDFDKHDKERVIRALLWAGAPDSIIDRATSLVEAGRQNEGFTYSNPENRRSVTGVGRTDSGPEFMDSAVHEIFHIAQDIATTDDLNLAGEDIAYLAGDISRSISDIVCEMSCPHCHKKGPS